MKKILALLFAILMVVALCACANNGTDEKATGGDDKEATVDAKDLVDEAFIDPIKDWSKYNDLILVRRDGRVYAVAMMAYGDKYTAIMNAMDGVGKYIDGKLME